MQQSVIGRAAVDLAVRKIWANFGEPSEPYDLNKQGIYEAQIFPHNDVGSFFYGATTTSNSNNLLQVTICGLQWLQDVLQ